jgi:hypothetical protein
MPIDQKVLEQAIVNISGPLANSSSKMRKGKGIWFLKSVWKRSP